MNVREYQPKYKIGDTVIYEMMFESKELKGYIIHQNIECYIVSIVAYSTVYKSTYRYGLSTTIRKPGSQDDKVFTVLDEDDEKLKKGFEDANRNN